jgi:putative oxidoreductase
MLLLTAQAEGAAMTSPPATSGRTNRQSGQPATHNARRPRHPGVAVTAAGPQGWGRRVRATAPRRHLLIARIVAGVPLLGIGLAHVAVPDLPMRPLVEAAGFPFAALVAPVAVAAEIVAGLALLAGLWARVGAALAVPTMLGAVYAHLVIDTWPNGAANEPPLALPLAVALAAAYVLWRGAGRWSLDRRGASG